MHLVTCCDLLNAPVASKRFKRYANASHSNYADVSFWYSRYPMRSLNLQNYPVDAGYRGTSIFKLMKQYGYTTGYISSQNEL
jgi:hypothetical protein